VEVHRQGDATAAVCRQGVDVQGNAVGAVVETTRPPLAGEGQLEGDRRGRATGAGGQLDARALAGKRTEAGLTGALQAPPEIVVGALEVEGAGGPVDVAGGDPTALGVPEEQAVGEEGDEVIGEGREDAATHLLLADGVDDVPHVGVLFVDDATADAARIQRGHPRQQRADIGLRHVPLSSLGEDGHDRGIVRVGVDDEPEPDRGDLAAIAHDHERIAPDGPGLHPSEGGLLPVTVGRDRRRVGQEALPQQVLGAAQGGGGDDVDDGQHRVAADEEHVSLFVHLPIVGNGDGDVALLVLVGAREGATSPHEDDAGHCPGKGDGGGAYSAYESRHRSPPRIRPLLAR